MSTPTENFEIAADESSAADDRRRAIDGLEAANECDMLASLVRDDGLADDFRKQALTKLEGPQCKATMRQLAEDSELSEPLQKQAEELLGESPDDAGAGP